MAGPGVADLPSRGAAMAQIKSRRAWTIPYSLQFVEPLPCLQRPMRMPGCGSVAMAVPLGPVQGKQFWLSSVKEGCRSGAEGTPTRPAHSASNATGRPVPLVRGEAGCTVQASWSSHVMATSPSAVAPQRVDEIFSAHIRTGIAVARQLGSGAKTRASHDGVALFAWRARLLFVCKTGAVCASKRGIACVAARAA